MPTYAYVCAECAHAFDAVQSFSDDALTECPECGGKLRKQYGSIGVTFNGSGFYRTDSRSSGEKRDVSGGGSESGSGSSKKDSGAGTTQNTKSAPGSNAGASAPAAASS